MLLTHKCPTRPPSSQAARRDQNRIAQREFRLRKQQRVMLPFLLASCQTNILLSSFRFVTSRQELRFSPVEKMRPSVRCEISSKVRYSILHVHSLHNLSFIKRSHGRKSYPPGLSAQPRRIYRRWGRRFAT